MPPLVDQSPFIPPPPGVSQGGAGAGFYSAFPGAATGGQSGYVFPASSIYFLPCYPLLSYGRFFLPSISLHCRHDEIAGVWAGVSITFFFVSCYLVHRHLDYA